MTAKEFQRSVLDLENTAHSYQDWVEKNIELLVETNIQILKKIEEIEYRQANIGKRPD